MLKYSLAGSVSTPTPSPLGRKVPQAIRWASRMLELIDKGFCSHTHPTPLLFIHGAWHAAWCWDDHFLDFFADWGFRASR